MSHPPEGVGQRIRKLREAQGIGLAELARTAAVSKGYLHDLENQPSANPTLDTLRRMADALNVTIADLIGAAKVKPVLSDQVPPGLQDLVKEMRAAGEALDPDTISSLSGMRYRGQRPSSKEDFKLLLYVLKQTTAGKRR
jgi:transcriptional regulator with XRE-family HTH domain